MDPFGQLFTLIASHASGRMKISYADVGQYGRFLREVVGECQRAGQACGHYVAVTNVDSATFECLSTVKRAVNKTARMTYDSIRKQSIVRLMPGPIHESMGIDFFCEIRDAIRSIPGHPNSIFGTAATRRRARGDGSKQWWQ